MKRIENDYWYIQTGVNLKEPKFLMLVPPSTMRVSDKIVYMPEDEGDATLPDLKDIDEEYKKQQQLNEEN